MLLSCVQLPSTSPAAPGPWLCQQPGGKRQLPPSPVCCKTQLYLLFLNGVKKSVCRTLLRPVCRHLPTFGRKCCNYQPWENWESRKVASLGLGYPSVVPSRNEHLFVFYFFNTKLQVAQLFSSISTLLLCGNNKIPVRCNQRIP